MVTLWERDSLRQRQIENPIAEFALGRVVIRTSLEGGDDDHSDGDLVVGFR